jgi:hypothetical protein
VVGLISNATGNRGELLQWVLNALDVPCDMDAAYVSKFQTLQDFVIGQYSQNRHVVLIIDEAQNLSIEGLEELRMLTNINSNKDELLQLILDGPARAARDDHACHELRQFAQRVTASFHISDMDLRDDARVYPPPSAHAAVRARNSPTGPSTSSTASRTAFPRLINKLADFAMVYAVTSDKTQSTRTPSSTRCSTTTSSSRRSIRLNSGGCRMKAEIKFYWRQILRRLPLMMAIVILFTALGLVQAVRLPASTRPRRGFLWSRRRSRTTSR